VNGDSSRAASASSGKVDLDRHDLRAGHHHLVYLLVREVEDLVEHLALAVLDLAGLARGADEHLQLGLRMSLGLGARRRQAEEAEHERSGPLQ